MQKMTNSSLSERLHSLFERRILASEELYDCLVIEVAAPDVFDIIQELKSESQLSFNFLTLIGGVHYPESTGQELCVVYHMHSWKHALRLRIKTYLSAENPRIQSITPLFDCANWMERETYDFFGIQFDNHPNLTRILNMDEMDYFPMLKQHPLEDATREDKDDRFFGR
ncbi:MAG: NADH-quinone oxidoreductase subunit C [Bacteroidetes bacterium]|nr:NADH-quinone oxidoreductase subunit C [Bacteroidota bacterium]